MAIHVSIPFQCSEERLYIVDTMLRYFLGVQYTCSIDPHLHYELRLPNGRSIEIVDDFWNHYGQEYLDKNHIPTELDYIQNEFSDNERVPILYGKGQIKNTTKGLRCEADLFASAFFMLSRWEESVQADKHDEYGRFWAQESLAVKKQFITQPVVNCYAVILKNLCIALGYNDFTKSTNKIQLSVDIDYAQRWASIGAIIKSSIGDIIKRKSIKLCISNIHKYCSNSDTYNTYQRLHKLAEKHNVNIKWYILCTPQNLRFFANNKELISLLKKPNSTIGLHPSIAASGNAMLLETEKKSLETILNQSISHSRFHYLTGEIPQCWHILENQGILNDSSLYYTNAPGFRTGSCTAYPLFSIQEHRPLNIIEEPLIIMDASILHGDENAVIEQFIHIKAQCQKHNGLLNILWHNSSFENEWKKHETLLNVLLSDNIQ